MKWTAQVAHVVRKDLYLSRWLLVAYAGLVLGATGGAIGWWGDLESGVLWTFSLVLLGMTLVALLIQADSPQQPNAFWVSLPLHRSAVFTAKVTGAILFILILPVLGQVAGLFAYSVPHGEFARMLGRSALLFAVWLGVAAVIAALTPDLRSFALAFVLVLTGAMFFLNFLFANPDAQPRLWLLQTLLLASALIVVAHQYRTRNVRRGVWLAAMLVIVIPALPLKAPGSAPDETPAEVNATGSPGPGPLAMKLARPQYGASTMLDFRSVGDSPTHRYVLRSPVVQVRMTDGSSTTAEISNSRIWMYSPILPGGDEFSWLGDPDRSPRSSTSVFVEFSPEQRAALARGDARLVVSGQIEVLETRIMAELPLTEGVESTFSRYRIQLLDIDNPGGGPELEVRSSFLALPEAGRSEARSGVMDERPEQFALVNRRRQEALELTQVGSSRGNAWLVLPGLRRSTTTLRLRAASALPPVQVSDEWLREARLVIVHWVPLRRYPIVIDENSEAN